MAENEEQWIGQLAERHAVSPAAVRAVLAALRRGGGRMAQFSHADFGGMSQWSPGMAMVGEMFNSKLTSKLDALCTDIAAGLESHPASAPAGTGSASERGVSYRSTSAASSDWWPAGLGRPASTGAQNNLRYAVFPDSGRLAIDDGGALSLYDTEHHRIFGVAQAQSSDRTISFTSQEGLVRIADLRKITA
jgi:hypothetical protein